MFSACTRSAIAALLLALGTGAVVGCASPETEEAGTSGDAVTIEQRRLDELVAQTTVATQRSEELKQISLEFVGVREIQSIGPIFTKAAELSSALEPILSKLEQRLTETAPAELAAMGATDVPEADLRAVVEQLRGLRTKLSAELSFAASQVLAVPSGALSEAQKADLRKAINAYSDILFFVSARLSDVTAQLRAWLGKASKPAALATHDLAVSIQASCASQQGTARASWEQLSAKTKDTFLQTFPDTLDNYTCEEPREIGTTNFCFVSKCTATYRIAGEIEIVPKVLRGEASSSAEGAANSWATKCTAFLQNLQTFTVPNRKVVGASCGERKEIGTTNFIMESSATMLIVRR